MEKLKEIPIEQIKNMTQKMLDYLHDLEINTVEDLFTYFPYRYENYEVMNIHTAPDNEKITVVGDVVSEPVFNYYGHRHSRLFFSMSVNDVIIKVVAFNREFLRGKITKGMCVTVTGKFERMKAQITANELKLSKLEDNRIIPVYTLKTLQRNYFLNVMKKAFTQYGTLIDDDMPLGLLKKYRLLGSRDAYFFAHFPSNAEEVKQVTRRIKYEELLKFELKMLYIKDRDRTNNIKDGKVFDEVKVREFIASLPFELTNDQKTVTAALLEDLKTGYQMNRLIQGDVGSGKTVVAAIAMYANFLSGFQSCLMAPTEILASQHYQYLENVFKPYGLRVELLTSSITGKSRAGIQERLKAGEIAMLVGTHALISDGVDFNRLGFIVVDEQHRFGVNQRKILREKGEMPDMLFLSATPIPRTLALTAFGDMDVSNIKQMPKGRKEVKTLLIRSRLEKRLVQFMEEIINKQEQVYIITPLIEESEKIDLENAESVYEKYRDLFAGRFNVGLLHGRMAADEKASVMNQFKNNEIQILVSTTVIEVGVDVPNATLMVIIDAHRFGLAQLHQLRGRVGRSAKQSYCILVSDYDQDKSLERLDALTKTNSGFDIAEADLKLRGPGDFFGVRQSGLPKFKMADLINDFKILETARGDAEMIIKSGELFSNPEYFALKYYIEQELIANNEFFD